MLDAICKDQLVLAILDDDSKRYPHGPGDHRFKDVTLASKEGVR